MCHFCVYLLYDSLLEMLFITLIIYLHNPSSLILKPHISICAFIFFIQINQTVDEHIRLADMSTDNSWQLLAEDGDLRVYKQELIENNLVIDPIKAVHTIKVCTR